MKNILLAFRTLLIIIGIVSFALFLVEPLQDMFTRSRASKGSVVKFRDDKLYCNLEITDYSIENDTLYILFTTNSVVKCYSTQGDYLHSFRYYGYNNGYAKLHSDGDYVYLEDPGINIYVFKDGECIEYIDHDESAERVEALREYLDGHEEQMTTGKGESFFVKKASMWKRSRSETEAIMYRHPMTVLLYAKHTLLFSIACFSLCAVIEVILKRMTQ